jgi:uncharacterized RDD family membrane protein YckC
VSAVIATIGGFLIRVGAEALGRDLNGGGMVAVGYLLSLPIVFLTYSAVSWSFAGRTPGMALFGVRVVRLDGTPVNPARSVVRALGYIVSAILMLGFIWIAVDRRRQGFHDKLAGTFVIYDDSAKGMVARVDARKALAAERRAAA